MGVVYSATTDPRQEMGNHIVANRMRKDAINVIAPNVRGKTNLSHLYTIRSTVQRVLSGTYVPTFVEDVQVDTPVVTSDNGITADVLVKFFRYADYVRLNINLDYYTPVVV